MKTPLYIGTGVVGILLGFVLQSQVVQAQAFQYQEVSIAPIQFMASSQTASLGAGPSGSCGG